LKDSFQKSVIVIQKEYLFSRPALKLSVSLAQVAELVDALDSKSSFLGSAGSIPALGTF
jgi:hypothetical protein